jgi:hypothetical protein
MDAESVARNVSDDDHLRFRVGQLVKVVPAWIFAPTELWSGPQSIFANEKAVDSVAPGTICLILEVDTCSYKVLVNSRLGWIDYNEICEV